MLISVSTVPEVDVLAPVVVLGVTAFALPLSLAAFSRMFFAHFSSPRGMAFLRKVMLEELASSAELRSSST